MLTVYVACKPVSKFTVRVGGQWYSGHCDKQFQNSGGFDVKPTDRPTVELEIPAKTQRWLVAVPYETPSN